MKKSLMIIVYMLSFLCSCEEKNSLESYLKGLKERFGQEEVFNIKSKNDDELISYITHELGPKLYQDSILLGNNEMLNNVDSIFNANEITHEPDKFLALFLTFHDYLNHKKIDYAGIKKRIDSYNIKKEEYWKKIRKEVSDRGRMFFNKYENNDIIKLTIPDDNTDFFPNEERVHPINQLYQGMYRRVEWSDSIIIDVKLIKKTTRKKPETNFVEHFFQLEILNTMKNNRSFKHEYFELGDTLDLDLNHYIGRY